MPRHGMVFYQKQDTYRLQSVIKKAKRLGYLPSSFCNFGELCADSDEKLFFSVRYNPYHVLHQLLPSVKTTSKGGGALCAGNATQLNSTLLKIIAAPRLD